MAVESAKNINVNMAKENPVSHILQSTRRIHDIDHVVALSTHGQSNAGKYWRAVEDSGMELILCGAHMGRVFLWTWTHALIDDFFQT